MSYTKKHSKAWNIVKWIVLGLLLVAIGSSIGIIFSRLNRVDTTRDLNYLDYSTGTLATTATGTVKIGDETDSDLAIRTGYLEASKINKITVNDGNNLSYYVFTYDANKTCTSTSSIASKTASMTNEQVKTAIGTAKYVRIVLVSSNTAVSLINRNDFIKQITVTIDR